MTLSIKPEEPGGAVDSRELDALKAGYMEAFGDVRERLAKLEGKAEHLATKHEVERLRSWLMGGFILFMLSILGIILGFLRL